MGSRLNCIDLFAGCGGLSLGLKQAGFEVKLAIEKSPMAGETYYHNFIQPSPGSRGVASFPRGTFRRGAGPVGPRRSRAFRSAQLPTDPLGVERRGRSISLLAVHPARVSRSPGEGIHAMFATNCRGSSLNLWKQSAPRP